MDNILWKRQSLRNINNVKVARYMRTARMYVYVWLFGQQNDVIELIFE